MRSAVDGKALTFGPVTQHAFLMEMGIDIRLVSLLETCREKDQEALKSGYHMIVDNDKMGERFKFFAMFPEVLGDHLKRFPVTGFSTITGNTRS